MALRAVARVNLAAIERNCRRLAAVARPASLCAVVKADGYGHGAVEVARAAQAGGAAWLAVATAEEARVLRCSGIGGRILVLGALSSEELAMAVAARADVVAWREGFVAQLARASGAAGTGVHVKLDTGMGRLGTRDVGEAQRVAAQVAMSRRLKLVGGMTHLATADDDPEFLAVQLERFSAFGVQLQAAYPSVLLHAANSAATLAEPSSRCDAVRCGVALYGLDPFHRDPAVHGLEPAMELCSYLAEVSRDERGHGVGVAPIGCGDGARRAMGDAAHALVGGRRVRVSAVAMDVLTLDLGAQPATVGDEVVLIGSRGGVRLLAEEFAGSIDTINYEVTCAISPRVVRRYHRDGVPAGGLSPVGRRLVLLPGR